MRRILLPDILRWMLLPAVLLLLGPKAVQATSQTWQLTMGAESKDEARQAMAFLPAEIWILQGDNITWTTQSHEGHTVTVLDQTATGAPAPGTTRPANGTTVVPPTGCAGGGQGGANAVTPNNSEYVGTGSDAVGDTGADSGGTDTNDLTCVNSGTLALFTPGQTPVPPPTTYTINFPVAGNFKFVCLIHHDMTGVVHVLSTGSALPHNQDFYDDEAKTEAQAILSDTDHANDGDDTDDRGNWHSQDDNAHTVVTRDEVIADGGGHQYLAIMRFLPSTIYVHVNDTVTWTNDDASEPHTVTFDPYGEFPSPGADPPGGVGSSKAADGTVLGTLPNAVSCASAGNPAPPQPSSNCFDSNIFGPANQDEGPAGPNPGLPQNPPGTTHVQVTFTAPGTYNYYCRLHDELGMEGKVVVLP
jgi:plastocyanin